ncbi:MAG: agmatinase [Bacteroidales bacterium]|nr:agmatinase [Bacteroidales bacterium]
MLERNIENFIGCDASYEDADIVLFGAPFDSTTSYRPGTRFGSAAIRHESYGLETYSPYQDKDLTDYQVFDSGDIELSMGSSQIALDQISERTRTILEDGKLPLMIGGEHLVTLGAFREVFKMYPDVHIIHFDAHTDLRDDYLGVQLSHACVIRRCHDLVGDGHIHQFGIRSGDRPEFRWAAEGHTDMHKFNLDGLAERVRELADKPVYFTIDLDVLDPSIFPGTGTPEAGGIGFMDLIEAIQLIGSCLNVVGCDVNELSPTYDQSGVSTAVACKVVRELILALNK